MLDNAIASISPEVRVWDSQQSRDIKAFLAKGESGCGAGWR
jgi:hypothetical protein